MRKITVFISALMLLSFIPCLAYARNSVHIPILQQGFGDDGGGPPVEDPPPPAPIDDWVPFCMILGMAYTTYKLVLRNQKANN